MTIPAPTDRFVHRHLGIDRTEVSQMVESLGVTSLEALIEQAVPEGIRLRRALNLPDSRSDYEALAELRAIAQENQVFRSYLGMGYYGCITPPVIQRNILENPGWYTQYTPYQAEIAQGRLEALLNFQTMVMDLTGMEIANASLLDEGTAAAEAMTMVYGLSTQKEKQRFLVDNACHPQVIAVVRTRALPLGIDVVVGDPLTFTPDHTCFGLLLAYPGTDGRLVDYTDAIAQIHQQGGLAIATTDLLALTVLQPPSQFDFDVVVGNSQRFGVGLGYGGPHAAFFATREAFKRQLPGRVVGVSKDVHGQRALRLALQTREQHIRRDKATSNICTAQVLLAVMAGMYAVYHGPEGLRAIAQRVHRMTQLLAAALHKMGYVLRYEDFFDTLRVEVNGLHAQIRERAIARGINLRYYPDGTIGMSLDETVTAQDLTELIEVWAVGQGISPDPDTLEPAPDAIPQALRRQGAILAHPIFQSYHSETELLRYMHRLQSKDLSLAHAMIPLGSCTMKLNATAEMIPVTWPEFAQIHPFAPLEQTQGYQKLFTQLETWLAEITGFAAVSLQPNAGSQGEYAGLLVIREYHRQRGQAHRHVCLIPQSAHGTNPASAVMAGMTVVAITCDSEGNIDLTDLKAKATQHQEQLAALMVTYPSTHGVFEAGIREICDIVHYYGGQVYMDGANLNAQVGLCRPGDFGADVCHLNLHKTFCIPHGGGGPGVGPIGVAAHLVPFLPSHPLLTTSDQPMTIAAAPWGSASILPISWMYIAMMGPDGLTRATEVAILSANYIAHRLAPHYPILYRGAYGRVAHECILDLRQCKTAAGIEVDDIAKRLMDYGFHAPTVSWPVPGTMMVEPTESESLGELDRFCDAMIAIKAEIDTIAHGTGDRHDNPLKNAPHTAASLMVADWQHPYSREQAAYPATWTREHKFWVPVGRVDNAYGDRHFFCACTPMEDYL
ncbi:MAG: aminomethyl-transferring glycine dehydrogenase [Oscillatoriales cyanobacterium SM2_2_1]|nr:aminomethyl-transferring glycine dehydrogenase [Oscillatoriales cyanobacterium SM2_2_1]